MPTSRKHIPGISAWAAGALLLVLSIASAGQAGAADSGQRPGWRGRSLTEALRELQSRGLVIVFTSRLVRPEMRVESEPVSTEPRRILDEILAPHGLRAESSVGGTLVVVPAPASQRNEAGIAGTVQPQESLQPMAFIHDEIVVRPSQVTLLDEEPLAPLSLSRGDIEALPHLAGDLFRALSLLPGTTANDVTAQFHVHGGRRDEIQILLDGQELYEAFHLQDFERALSVVEPGGLSGASLSTGAFPASYGDRMSGVLDMTTTVPSGPHQTSLSLSLLTAVAASGGSFRGGRGTWLASARRGSIDLASRLLGKEDPAFWDLFAKVGYRLGDRGSLRGHLLRANDTLDFQEARDGERKLFDTDYDSSYLWLTHQTLLGSRLLVETLASASELDRDRFGTEDEEEASFEILDRRASDVWGLGQSWSLQAAPRHTLKGGFEARRYESAYDYSNQAEPDFVLSSDPTEPRVGLDRFAKRFRGDHLGVHLADRFSPLEPVTVELGLRYDRHKLTGDTLLSPRVNLAWRLGEASVVRASWGHFHQSQRPYELQVEDGETRFSPAERSEHWVVGYERLFGQQERAFLRALRVEAYRREIQDPRPRYENLFEPLNQFPEAEPDRVRIAPSSSRAEGIEILLRGALGPGTDWWVNYAHASAKDRLRGREVRRQIDQTHTVNLFVNTRIGRSLDLSLAWRFHSGRPTTPVFLETIEDEEGETELIPVLGPLNSERLPSYHRMDLRASREWPLRSGRLVLFLDLQNLYDRRNLAGFDVQLDEEEGELTVEPEDWPGFFPSLGIRWEF
jgi:vitamin B12 transporter